MSEMVAADEQAVPRRKYGQWISAVLVAAAVAYLLWAIATNDNILWGVVAKYIWSEPILEGLQLTIVLTIAGMIIGILGGIVVAVMRLSDNFVLKWVSIGYVWLIRGTPLLIQILLWFNMALFFPRLGIGPLSVSTNAVISPMVAALIALSLNEIAYMAEIMRGGILSVAKGQTEAGAALGMTNLRILRRIVLPQAMKVVVPPTGNQLITLLKLTSLVAVIGAGDLLTKAQAIGVRLFTPMEMLMVATFWYVVLTTIATLGQHLLERRLERGRGVASGRGLTFMTRLRRNISLSGVAKRLSQGKRF